MNQVGASRLRGFVASLLALLLSVSVLAVVASSPAGAANTASEALVDHDSDPSTSPTREFAGENRYTTSLALAEAYVEKANSAGFVDALILASGESLIDAATAAGLSAARTAPVVLTTSNRLSRAIENFIVDEFIAEVVIIGGTDSISQAVEDDLNDIDTVSTVTRIAGDDRYSTSALVAAEITTVGEYCDTAQVSAMVVNVDSSFADVIAAGPLAYANEIPILLTAADSLPADVASYLTSVEIERVVIVGGTAAVSQAVVDEITAAGVSDITRIAGENRFSTAVSVRTALAECDDVTLDGARAALINADAAADGVSAAPLLALGLGDEEAVTPALLVTAEGLPAETEAFLSGLPIRNTRGNHVNVSLTAIGGETVVPASVMQAAIDAAVTSEPLTATIKATIGTREATVTFSGPVTTGTGDGGAQNEAYYTINGNPLLQADRVNLAGNTATIVLTGDIVVGPRTNLGYHRFVAGDVVGLVGGKVRGVGTDARTVEAASFTVVAAAPDRLRPRVTIFAPEGGHELRIQVTEANPGAALTEDQVLSRVMLGRTALSNITGSNAPALLTETSASSYTICLFGVDGNNCEADPPEGRELLSAGDLVTVAAEAFSDVSGNTSRTTVTRVVANSARPAAIRATVTEPVPYDPTPATPGDTMDASWSWIDSNGPNDGNNARRNYLTITAKADGIAGGAAGNAWSVDWFAIPGDADKAPVATVTVFENRQVIRIGFDADASLFTVVSALLDHDTVTENFNVTSDVLTRTGLGEETVVNADGDPMVFDPANILTRDDDTDASEPGTEVGKPSTQRRPLTGGESAVTLRLVYNDILESFAYAMLIADNMGSDDFPATTGWTPAEMLRQSLVTEISVTLHSANVDELPALGDTINLRDGLATSYKVATPNASAEVSAQRLRAG